MISRSRITHQVPIAGFIGSLLWVLMLTLSSCAGSVGGNDEDESTGVWFVDSQNSSGKEDGSAEFPYTAVQTAILQADAGDLVVVAAGSYEGFMNISRDIRVIGAGPEQTLLDAEGHSFVVFIGSGLSSETLIEGFTLSGAEAVSGALFLTSPVIIQNCRVTGNGPEIIDEDDDTDDDDTDDDEETISFVGALRLGASDNAWVRNCAIVDNDLNGVTVVNPVLEGRLSGCLVACNSGEGVVCQGNANTQDSNIFLENCTVAYNGGRGMYLDSFAVARMTNCLFFGNTGIAVEETEQAGDPVVRHCDIVGGYRDADTDAILDVAADINALSPPGTNEANIVVDPQFRDAELPDLDLGLQPTSPLINAGDPAFEFLDLDGSLNDIGASGGPQGLSSLDCTGEFLVSEGAFARWEGSFVVPVSRAPFGLQEDGSWLLDLDDDGSLDRLILDNTGRLQILSSHGAIPFEALKRTQKVEQVLPVDADLDGRVDLMLLGTAPNGEATFQLHWQREKSWAPGFSGIQHGEISTFADLDGDGALDWISGHQAWLRHQPYRPYLRIVPGPSDWVERVVVIGENGRSRAYPGRGQDVMTLGLGEARSVDVRIELCPQDPSARPILGIEGPQLSRKTLFFEGVEPMNQLLLDR